MQIMQIAELDWRDRHGSGRGAPPPPAHPTSTFIDMSSIAEAAKPQTAAVGAIARASWFQRLPGGLLAQRLLLQRHVLLPARLLGGDVRPAVLPA